MSDIQKITSSHLTRVAVVYLRQSSAAQVEHNRESTDRQYALVHKADELGWPSAAFSCTSCPAASTVSATTAYLRERFEPATSSASNNGSPRPRLRLLRWAVTSRTLTSKDLRLADAAPVVAVG